MILGAIFLMPGPSWAGFVGGGLPAPEIRGPASLSVGQPFVISLTYPTGSTPEYEKAQAYDLQIWHCRSGKDRRPGLGDDLFPTTNCGFYKMHSVGLPKQSGHANIDMNDSLEYEYETETAAKAEYEQWIQGTTYVRARLLLLSNGKAKVGPWCDWHRTVIGHNRIHRRASGGGVFADRTHIPAAVAMRGLKPPVITAPKPGQILRTGTLALHISLPKHTRYSRWRCCDYQMDRAKIVTKENNDYVASHTAPGATPEGAFPTPRELLEADDLLRTETGASLVWDFWPVSKFSPHSHKFGYRYWVRVREHYAPDHAPGPWSAWRSFVVQEPAASGLPMRRLPGSAQSQQKSGQHSRSQRRAAPRRAAPAVQEPHLRLPAQQ